MEIVKELIAKITYNSEPAIYVQRNNIKQLARETASEVLRQVRYGPTSKSPYVPIEDIARYFGLTHKQNLTHKQKRENIDNAIISPSPQMPFNSLSGVDGFLSKRTSLNGDVFYEAVIYSRSYRRRFTIAHELGHLFFAELFPRIPQTSEMADEFCDELAGHILLPDCLITYLFGCTNPILLDIREIERVAKLARVSISCLIRGLEDASNTKILSLENIVILSKLDKSRTKKENYAPRVWVYCPPKEGYLPIGSS